jgi:transcriptional regulator with XRE-family HTH domain
VGRSPAAARRRLGTELKNMREAAGRKIEDSAHELGCSTAKISRLENGKGLPHWRDVRDLVAFYGTVGERDDYLASLVEDGRAKEWFDTFRDFLRGDMAGDHQQRYFQLEQDASVIKHFEADLIPGLLQSKDYIDAICRVIFPEHSDRDREQFVEFRLKRQAVVLGKGSAPELSVILSEAAIIRRIGGVAVMRGQLEALHADLNGPLRDVNFRVTPLRTEARGVLGGPFTILKYADKEDEDVAYLEGREGATYLYDDGVARYEEHFGGLERDSLSRKDSLARLAEEIELLAKEGRTTD